MFEDSRGDIWVSNNARLSRFESASGKIVTMGPDEGLPKNSGVIAFAEDKQGTLWFGFYFGGIARYRNGEFKYFGPKDGLPESQVIDLWNDSRGHLWIGTLGYGLFVIDKTEAETPMFRSFSTLNGLSSNQTLCLTEDRFGRLFVGTGRGISRIDPNGSVKVFTQADGLPSNFITRCAAAPNGYLWFVSGNTLVKFKPELEQESSALPVFIDKISIGGVQQRISALGETTVQLPEISADSHQFQIDYFAQTFASAANIHYQYALDDHEWSNPTDQQTVNLDLSAGKHSFAVRAVRADGVTSVNPATVEFTILSPFWMRWWFILLSVLFFGGVVYSLYHYRIANLRKVNLALAEANLAEESLRRSREERIIELESVRSRIATDLHDDIGASLTQIAILSEVATQQAAIGYGKVAKPLQAISGVSNELVGTMSDIVWAINPARDHLHDLIQRMRRFASDVLAAKDIEFEFNAPSDEDDIAVGTNLRREVFLIFKESINNIVKHSLAAKVEIQATISDEYFDLTITDDGQGFTIPDTSPQLYSEEIGGNGIVNMRRRAAEMNGEFEILSAPGAGTTIKLRLPLDNRTAAVQKATIQSGGDSGLEVA
jgi:signal transduction histidine kinase